MSYGFPPELDRLVQAKMASGGYATEDELLVSAIHALDHVQVRHEELRSEIRDRLSRAGKGLSRPLDLIAFRTEARNRLASKT